MLPKDEVQKLLAKSWELDCRDIELTQRSAANPNVYSGPGWIRLGEDGQIRFKILATEPHQTIRRLVEEKPEPGTVIPAEQYYNLRAKDEWNREWTVERIRPSKIARGLESSVIEGTVTRLVKTSTHGSSGAPSCVQMLVSFR